MALVQLQAYMPRLRKRKFFTTNIYIPPSQWHEENSLVINHPLAAQLNWQLTDLKRSYEKKVIDLIKRNDKCTLQELELDYKSGYMSFYDFYEEEIELARSTRAKGTIQTYESALRKARDYRSNVYFSDLNYKWLEGFNSYLHCLKLKQTVIAKYHKIIKRMINQAKKKNHLDKNPYEKFVIKAGHPEPRTFLSRDEISRLEDLKFEPEEMYLDIIRLGFLFSCYTSLRDSNNKILTARTFIKDGAHYFMKYKAVKSKKTNTIPLSKLFPISGSEYSKPELILHRQIELNKQIHGPGYMDMPLFGNQVSQTTNRRLKVIAKRAGINKNLTTHVGRHTFGTHMANKVEPHLLQALMQHSDYKTTLAYVHLNDRIIQDGLEKINW